MQCPAGPQSHRRVLDRLAGVAPDQHSSGLVVLASRASCVCEPLLEGSALHPRLRGSGYAGGPRNPAEAVGSASRRKRSSQFARAGENT
jgi:hypothetical protein